MSDPSPADPNKIYVSGEIASTSTAISNSLLKLVVLAGDLDPRFGEERVLLPLIELRWAGPAVSSDGQDPKHLFGAVITMHNALFLLQDMANDLSWAASELRSFSAGELKPLQRHVDLMRDYARAAADAATAIDQQLAEVATTSAEREAEDA